MISQVPITKNWKWEKLEEEMILESEDERQNEKIIPVIPEP